jgi:hypothetical protein
MESRIYANLPHVFASHKCKYSSTHFSWPAATLTFRIFPVTCVKADMTGAGPAKAFDFLESKLPTPRGRKFCGINRVNSDGTEDYYSLVARIDTDDPLKVELETGVISGGKYARRKTINWERIISAGELPKIAQDLARSHDTDDSRFAVEFYRSQDELTLFMPVRG